MTSAKPSTRKAVSGWAKALSTALLCAVVLAFAGAQTASARAPVTKITVKRGDSVGKLARKHGISSKRIIRLNRLKRPYQLRIGQRLKLPARVHVVRRGENLTRIARRYRVRMSSLVRINGLRKPYKVRIGQKLRLTGKAAAPPRRRETRSAKRVRSKTAERRSARARTKGGNASPRKAAPRTSRVIKAKLVGGRKTAAGARRKASRINTRSARRIVVGPPPSMSGRGFAWPLRGRIVGRYGPRKGGLRNDGVNIAAPTGTIVRAAENGVVVYAGDDVEGFGELLLIKHARGWVTAYAHNDRFLVRRGQRVRRGQPIARVGNTGAVLRPQLHFQIRKRNRPVDPLTKLAGRPASRRVASR